jgi:hypothetical protein
VSWRVHGRCLDIALLAELCQQINIGILLPAELVAYYVCQITGSDMKGFVGSDRSATKDIVLEPHLSMLSPSYWSSPNASIAPLLG